MSSSIPSPKPFKFVLLPTRRRSSCLEGITKATVEVVEQDESDEGGSVLLRPFRKTSITSSLSVFSLPPTSTSSSLYSPFAVSPDEYTFECTDPFAVPDHSTSDETLFAAPAAASPSPPSLPTELQLAVLSFCDTDTLAIAGRVSLAFLEMSAPLLYRDVVIEGTDQLDRLMCERDSTHQPQLDRYLSLSQIRTFTLKETEWIVRKPHLVRSRLLPSSLISPSLGPPTLKVDTFSFAFPPYEAPVVPYPADFVKDPLKTCIVNLCEQVLRLFDPTHVHLQGFYLTVPPRHDAILSVPVVSLNIPWNNLKTIRLKNVVSSVALRDCGFAQSGRRFGLVVDMRAPSAESFKWLLQYAGADLIGPEVVGREGRVFEEDGEGEGSEDESLDSAEVWVDTEERKEEVVEHLRCVGKGVLSEAAVERRIRRIKVEVRTAGEM